MTADEVVARLEVAGETLMRLQVGGFSTRMRGFWPEIVRDFWENYGNDPVPLRPACPDAAQISAMDEALGWINLIPGDRYVLRRIVSVRALINPRTQRNIYTWRGVGRLLGADYRAVQRWHAQGIDLIVGGMAKKKTGQMDQNLVCIWA
jgi:hypothetical protein